MKIGILNALVLVVATTTLTGCGQALEEWVRAARPGFGLASPFEGQANLKLSPGTTVSSSEDISTKVHITITDRPLTSADVSARVSINRTRTEGISNE